MGNTSRANESDAVGERIIRLFLCVSTSLPCYGRLSLSILAASPCTDDDFAAPHVACCFVVEGPF